MYWNVCLRLPLHAVAISEAEGSGLSVVRVLGYKDPKFCLLFTLLSEIAALVAYTIGPHQWDRSED
jgi:hypothetical protein